MKDKLEKRIESIETRLDKLEGKQPSQDDWVWVSMDEDEEINLWNLRKHPEWDATYKVFSGAFCCDGGCDDRLDCSPNGLQPGMLCKAVKEWIPIKKREVYRILSVEQCNLPIEVDWRRQPHYRTGSGQPISYSLRPYLPGTDVLITCEFTEKKKEKPIFGDREALIALGVNKINDHQTLNCLHGYVICPDKSATPYSVNVNAFTERNKEKICKALGVPYPLSDDRKDARNLLFPCAGNCENCDLPYGSYSGWYFCPFTGKAIVPCPPPVLRGRTETCGKQPKLITLELLKERGVSCKWALDWFKYNFPSGGCTLLKLLKSVYDVTIRDERKMSYPLNWTQEKKDEAMWFILRDLWEDFA